MVLNVTDFLLDPEWHTTGLCVIQALKVCVLQSILCVINYINQSWFRNSVCKVSFEFFRFCICIFNGIFYSTASSACTTGTADIVLEVVNFFLRNVSSWMLFFCFRVFWVFSDSFTKVASHLHILKCLEQSLYSTGILL